MATLPFHRHLTQLWLPSGDGFRSVLPRPPAIPTWSARLDQIATEKRSWNPLTRHNDPDYDSFFVNAKWM
ncbi:MAG: hypothetical protein WB810_12190 [Candidatus Cybelea sp.]